MAKKESSTTREAKALTSKVRGLLTKRVDKKTVIGHLNASWDGTFTDFGDAAVLEMLRSNKFSAPMMYSWLVFYKTMRMASRAEIERILTTIERHHKKWLAFEGSTVDLVAEIYGKLRLPGQKNLFVMATKIAWLMRPNDVVIYDKQVKDALLYLAAEELIPLTSPVPDDPKARGGKAAVNATLDAYSKIDERVRWISKVCGRDLDACLRENKSQLPALLQANRLRLLDKLLWVYGRT
jgi:hypothetical protein